MVSTILVPVDGSANSNAAVDWAADLAAKYHAKLIVLHVIAEARSRAYRGNLRRLAAAEQAAESDLIEALAEEIVQKAAARARARGATKISVAVDAGNPAETILEHATKTKADLIVIGRRGLGRLKGLLLGSVSTKILQLAPCPCLAVR